VAPLYLRAGETYKVGVNYGQDIGAMSSSSARRRDELSAHRTIENDYRTTAVEFEIHLNTLEDFS